jgi:hypothetical protein
MAELDAKSLESLVRDKMLTEWRRERTRLDLIDRWYRWDPVETRLPAGATRELKALRELSRVPWLGLVVTSTAQCMYVDGYRSSLDPVKAKYSPDELGSLDPDAPPPGPSKPEPPVGPWKVWLQNGWDQRQIAVHRAMLAYGYSYATALPGKDFLGKPMPVIRGISPRKMYAVYEDKAADDWPEYAMQVLEHKDSGCKLLVFDEEIIYRIEIDFRPGMGANGFRLINAEPHDSAVCPVVRYTNELDLDGRTPGEIEPHIPLAARINKTSYDRMLVQHFNSWKIRWVTGMAEPDTQESANRKKLQLRQDDVLVAEDPDTKFGSLPETPLQGFIQAHTADVESLAAVTQTPAHELTGSMVNLSAEALAAARASLTQKVYERQKYAGGGHVQLLRLAAGLQGDEKHAQDFTGRVTWQDTSIRSLAQAVDALGKAAQMLQVPVEALWGRIPGVERQEVEEWIELSKAQDPIERLQYEIARQAAGGQPPALPAAPGAPAAPARPAPGAAPAGRTPPKPKGLPGHDPSSRQPAGSRTG